MPIHPRISARLTQDATIWVKTGLDGAGQATFASPVTIRVRWESLTTLTTDSRGRQVVYRARIWTPVQYSMGDFILLGTSVSATPVTNSQEVQDSKTIPSVDGKYEEYILFV